MTNPSGRSAPRRRRRRRTRQEKERRRAIIVAVIAVALFVLALVLYAGPLSGGDGKDKALPTVNPMSTPDITAASTATGTPSSTPSITGSTATGATGANGLPTLPGFTNQPNVTDLTALGNGPHRVVLTASSTTSMLAVAFSVKGEKSGKVYYNVKSPVVISRTITGGRPYAAIALQVGPTGTSGTCKVTIDGKVVDTRTVAKPYAVMGCVG